jgi:hypothetical protein
MSAIQNQEFIAGAVMAMIIVGAFYGSSVFRNVGLAALGGLILWVFFQHGGTSGIVVLTKALQLEFTSRPAFAQGAIIGALAVVAVVLALRERRPS